MDHREAQWRRRGPRRECRRVRPAAVAAAATVAALDVLSTSQAPSSPC
jgi:hypothetical protein